MFVRPTCPRCGCPAQTVVLRMARVECILKSDGTAGAIVHVRRGQGAQETYRCGGGHEWPAPTHNEDVED